MIFDIGSSLVHDNGALLLFFKDDLKLRADTEATPRPTTSPS
jgi:hypothetical protein